MQDELLAELRAEKTQLVTGIETLQAELLVEIRSVQPSDINPIADKIRALNALRSRLAEVNILLGDAQTGRMPREPSEE